MCVYCVFSGVVCLHAKLLGISGVRVCTCFSLHTKKTNGSPIGMYGICIYSCTFSHSLMLHNKQNTCDNDNNNSNKIGKHLTRIFGII